MPSDVHIHRLWVGPRGQAPRLGTVTPAVPVSRFGGRPGYLVGYRLARDSRLSSRVPRAGGRPRRGAARAGERDRPPFGDPGSCTAPCAPAPGRSPFPAPSPAPDVAGTWSAWRDRTGTRREAHGEGGEGRRGGGAHRAIPDLGRRGAHRIPRPDRCPAWRVAPFAG